jgi:hypothetical protein
LDPASDFVPRFGSSSDKPRDRGPLSLRQCSLTPCQKCLKSRIAPEWIVDRVEPEPPDGQESGLRDELLKRPQCFFEFLKLEYRPAQVSQSNPIALLPNTSPSNTTLAGEPVTPEQTCSGMRCSSRG